MDKQMIEEMAKEVYDNSNYSEVMSKDIARYIVKNGYRKIPENAVVLTGTEEEERFVDLLTEFDEMGFYPATTVPNPDEYARKWKRKLMYIIGQLRKETAEKFAERLKESKSIKEIADSGWLVSYVEVCNEFDEICKEIVEGK